MAGAISGFKNAIIKIYKIYKATIISPGITAALNKSPTLICITAPRIIKTILGGINCPSVPLAAITPLASFGEYLCLSITGRDIIVIITTLAPTIPVDAARIAPTITIAMASPPLIEPKSSPMDSSIFSAILLFSKINPIKINKGTAISVKFCIIP